MQTTRVHWRGPRRKQRSVIITNCMCVYSAAVRLGYWSSLLLQQLESVVSVVRATVSSIDSIAVIWQKHKILPRHNKDVVTPARKPTLSPPTLEMFSPDNTSWWLFCTRSGFSAWGSPSWDAPCRTARDGSAPHRGSPAAWPWRTSSKEAQQEKYCAGQR